MAHVVKRTRSRAPKRRKPPLPWFLVVFACAALIALSAVAVPGKATATLVVALALLAVIYAGIKRLMGGKAGAAPATDKTLMRRGTTMAIIMCVLGTYALMRAAIVETIIFFVLAALMIPAHKLAISLNHRRR